VVPAFFYAHPLPLLAGLLDDRLGVPLGQLLELGVSGQRLLQKRNLLGAHMAGVILALLPGLKLVVGASIGRAALEVVGGERAPFHDWDAGDLR
jgi:hypothetical protein